MTIDFCLQLTIFNWILKYGSMEKWRYEEVFFIFCLHRMRKKLWTIVIIVGVLIVILWLLRLLSGDEDTWLCTKQWWTKHGNPFASMPTTSCGSWSFTSLSSSMKILADRENNGYLPKAYTCEWAGSFPELTIKEIPSSAKYLAIVVDDPDAPGGTRNHLLLANISISGQSIVINPKTFTQWISWKNSLWELGRWAPCPPSGVHRYTFKVYALKKELTLTSGFSKETLLTATNWNILAESELIGLYQKGK